MANTLPVFKVVLLGEGCVGKTSIVSRYLKNTFDTQHITTLQAAFFDKKVNVDGKRLKLAIWDTAGQERFHALGPIYYRDSKGAILVYDITDIDSFERVKNWVKELRKMLGAECVLYIVGNKTDLERERRVSEEEARRYAESVSAKHFQTSAKLNRGVEELFLAMSRSLLENTPNDSPSGPSGRNPRSNVVIVDDAAASGSHRGCCG